MAIKFSKSFERNDDIVNKDLEKSRKTERLTMVCIGIWALATILLVFGNNLN